METQAAAHNLPVSICCSESRSCGSECIGQAKWGLPGFTPSSKQPKLNELDTEAS
jgi:hypothetical protein